MTRLLPWLRGAVAAMTLLLAALLCWQCIDIYAAGNAPENLTADGVHIEQVYRADDVGARLTTLAIPAAAYAVLIAVTAIVQHRAPKKPEASAMTADNRLRLMKRRVTELPEAAKYEETLRRSIWIATAAVLLLCAVMAGLFLLNGDNFVSWDLEVVMGEMLVHTAPWAAVALLAVYVALRACDKSCLREAEALRGQPTGKPAPLQEKPFPASVLRADLYAAAIVFIVLGVMNGGLRDVLVKAINICTECIGLG